MEKSPTIGKLSKALASVQSNLATASKNATNPHFKSKYADLNAIWDVCREPLAKNGLSIMQGNSVGLDGTIIVETILAHESGEWIQSELSMPLAKRDPQGVGSAVTYGRRYGLAAIVGIVADVDDDGNHASGHNSAPVQQAPRPVPQSATEPTLRDRYANVIKLACKELNEAGDSIKWTKANLDSYIEEMFGDGINATTGNEKQLETVSIDLTKRLATLKGSK